MSTIPLFHISQQQDERRKEWCKKHADEAHPKGVRDMSGAAWKYTILPTGCGCNIEIECIWCPGTKVILTEDDDGEFLYNLDGTKSWCSKISFNTRGCTTPEERAAHIQECVTKGNHMKHVDRDGDCKFCDHH